MAYDESLAKKISKLLREKRVLFREQETSGAMCFISNKKMLCGIYIDKTLDDNLLMAKIGEQAYEKEKSNAGILPMDYGGSAMPGYIFVKPEAFEKENELSRYLDLCIAFNEEESAKAPKTKKVQIQFED